MTQPTLRAGAVAGLVAALVTVGAATATTATAAEPARATGAVGGQNVCRSWIEATTEGLAQHRVGALCTSLDPDTRARGVADFSAQSDVHTEWISEVGRTYHSPWQAYIWKPPTSRMEYKTR